MRLPLFVQMRMAKSRKMAPAELQHSGILSLQYMNDELIPLTLFSWERPNGVFVIDEIAYRATRGTVITERELHKLRYRIAKTIYSATPLANFARHHCHLLEKRSCGAEDQALVVNGEIQRPKEEKSIPIQIAPKKPCRWCGKQVFYRNSWVAWDGTVRCNSRDCRRIDYLAYRPQSRGGVDLTPNQRKGLDHEAWDVQRAINYLLLIAKEEKRNGRKSTCDVRRRAANDPAHHHGTAKR